MDESNGSSKVTIDATNLAADWVYFAAGKHPPPLEELPQWLNSALTDWLRERPEIVVRAVLPIIACGTLMGIHVWYDVE